MSRPLISIVIPTYNRARKIEAAIKSVQDQTFGDWELIISDDGSNDNTKAIVQHCMNKDSRIHFIQHETNRGAQAARNSGIKAAKGEWIAFLDSDDKWLPESLSLRINRALQSKSSVVWSGAYIQHEGKPLEIYHLPKWQGNIYKDVISKEGPMFQSLLVKKSALEKINFLDERIPAYQEWDTSIRLAKEFEFAYEPMPTFIYDYTCPDSISRSSIRNAKGYSYIVGKHFWSILSLVGPGVMGYHYEVIANWYKDGGDLEKSNNYRLKAKIWKLISPTILFRKVRNVLTRSK